MKRLLSRVLIPVLLCALCLPAATAEEAYSAAVEAEVPEALETGNDGLTVEGVDEPPAEEPAPEEETAGEPDAPMTVAAPEAPEEGGGEVGVDEPEVSAPATGIKLSASSVKIGLKETYRGLTVSATPAGSALPAVSWRSDNEKVATVDARGAITGVKRGSARIYAKMENGGEVSCKVTVAKAPRKLVVKPKKATVGADGATVKLSYTLPKGAASKTITWTSSNPKVAVVDADGVVTGLAPGKATITVKAYNGKGGKCTVTVTAAPKSIAFASDKQFVGVGQKTKLAPSVTYEDGGKKGKPGITYAVSAKSKDAGCVTLNADTGEITGVRKGSCTIIATTYNGKRATLQVTVAVAPKAISLSHKSVSLGAKDVFSGLLANLTVPSGEKECATTLTWTSSNKKVATVDANGIVTARAKGKCTITATTVNGLKASCKVTVYRAPKKVSLKPAKGTLEVGETGQYKVRFSKGAGGTVRFESSDPSVATVDDNGKVTAVSEGTVTIKVITYNGKTGKAKLTVESKSGDVELPPTEYESIVSTTSEYRADMTNAEKIEYMIYCAQNQLGKPYIYGSGYKEKDPKGFDCSGLVYWSYKQIKVKVKDSAYRQGYDKSLPKIKMASLKRGDIVCFNTNKNDSDKSDHTGIYLGNGMFIHAATGKSYKVIISTLNSGFYNKAFSWGRRVLK